MVYADEILIYIQSSSFHVECHQKVKYIMVLTITHQKISTLSKVFVFELQIKKEFS
jgi:hypothetical protein